MRILKSAIVITAALGAANAYASVQVLSVRGGATINNQPLEAPANQELRITEDSVINTSSSGSAILRTDDGVVLVLGPSSTFEVKGQAGESYDGLLRSGTIVANGQPGANYRINVRGETLMVGDGTVSLKQNGTIALGNVSRGDVHSQSGLTAQRGTWFAVNDRGATAQRSPVRLGLENGYRGDRFESFMRESSDLANETLVLMSQGVEAGAVPQPTLGVSYEAIQPENSIVLNEVTLQILQRLGLRLAPPRNGAPSFVPGGRPDYIPGPPPDVIINPPNNPGVSPS